MESYSQDGFRLSPQQRYAWDCRDSKMMHPGVVYAALIVDMPNGSKPLLLAMDRVVSKHEILHTTFSEIEGLRYPLQLIRGSSSVWAPSIDRYDIQTTGNWPQELDSILDTFIKRRWDYHSGPLFEGQMVMLANRKIAVLIRASTLCSDRQGLWNVISELLQEMNEITPACVDEPLQYADVAEYFSTALESEQAKPGRRYWLKEHAKVCSASHFPSKLIRKDAAWPLVWSVKSDVVDRAKLLVDDGEDYSLRDLLTVCWAIVLSRYFGQQELTLGFEADGRQMEGLRGLPGLFKRTLPFMIKIDPKQSLLDLLKATGEQSRVMLAWQDYFPLDQFDAAIFLSGIVFEVEAAEQALGNPSVGYIAIDESLHPDRLKLYCSSDEKGLRLKIAYDPNALSEQDISALRDQLDATLSNAVLLPSGLVGNIPSLSSQARELLIHESSQPCFDGTDWLYVPERFRQIALQYPEKIAASLGKNDMSYGELSRRATQLADVLRGHGIGIESPVVIYMDRCHELLVSILATLAAGAFYIPLDPGYPPERLDRILEESKATVVLTKVRWKTELPLRGALHLYLDEDLSAPNEDLYPRVFHHSQALAYMIYTSGSTGRPKGVGVTHGALSNYIAWCEQKYNLDSGQGVLLHSAIGFDLTVTGLLAPLCCGQRIILVEGDDPVRELVSLLRRGADFTLLKVTPAHLQTLDQLMERGDFLGSVRTIIIGGEALFRHHIARWQELAPETLLINEYGPTEGTVGCTALQVRSNELLIDTVPIGRPISGAQVYVLDPELEPVPVGHVGEIYIGGAGVARGYFAQPQQTSDNFLPDPFSTAPGRRLYKTGDVARRSATGDLFVLGRIDDQVKVRGFRIELSEIECVLSEHSHVRQAAVLVRQQDERAQLIAYVSTALSSESLEEQLQHFLSSRLPAYMLPSRIVVLADLPLTSHGKVDKAALRVLGDELTHAPRTFNPPTNEQERLLAMLWGKALKIDQVGIHDDFFQLGGDSIISIQIVNRARQMGVFLTPKMLFQHRTISKLAGAIHEKGLEPIITAGVSPLEIPLSPIQSWFFEQCFSNAHHWNQASFFEAQSRLDPVLVENAISEVIARHDALQLRFTSANQRPVTAFLATRPVQHVSVLDLAGTHESKKAELLEAFAAQLQSNLNLTEGPILRVGLIQDANCKDRLLWIIHHLCVDVVSWGILVEDFTTAYRALEDGHAPDTATKSTSFRHWTSRLLAYSQSDELVRETRYWLANVQKNFAPIPVDFPGGENFEATSTVLWCSLSAEGTKELTQRVPRAHHTMINDVLLAALLQSYCHWSGHDFLNIDLENHGREELFDELDLSRTVGWFTCIFPVTLRLASKSDCVQNLRAVKERIRSIPNGGLGYGLLKYATQDGEARRAIREILSPEINFNYLGRGGQILAERSLLVSRPGVTGTTRDPATKRAYLLEVTGGINSRGELHMAFIYGQDIHLESSIRRLADGFIEALWDIIRNSIQPVPSISTTDLSLLQLQGEDIGRLIAELGNSEIL